MVIKKICIIRNEKKKDSKKLYNDTKKYFLNVSSSEYKYEIVTEDEINVADYLIVFGGDGTLLRASKKIIDNPNILVLAINLGSLGFLTEIHREEAFNMYENLMTGRYKIEKRKMLEVSFRKNNELKKYYALNEVVISKEKMIDSLLRVKLTSKNEGDINCYRADGVIIATPSGSTAYALSAGGPILKPKINAMLITPIAPHNLNTRSVVIDGSEEIVAKIMDFDRNGYFSIDSDKDIKIDGNDEVEIKYSDKFINLIIPEGRNYYEILKEKLKWGDDIIDVKRT